MEICVKLSMTDLLNVLGQRLVELRGDQSQRDFAARLGVHFNTLAAYERGEGAPDLKFVTKISEFSGKPVAWLLGVSEQVQIQTAVNVVPDGMVEIPRFNVRAAAGAGALALTEDVGSYFTVERDWLRRTLPGWAPRNAEVGILEVDGDSMYPTLDEAELVMAVRDPPQRIIDAGGIFVVLHHGHLRVKRVHMDMRSGDITLISDNRNYPPEIVLRERQEFDLRILALVFARIGKLRPPRRIDEG